MNAATVASCNDWLIGPMVLLQRTFFGLRHPPDVGTLDGACERVLAPPPRATCSSCCAE
jgi:hypothetical protein